MVIKRKSIFYFILLLIVLFFFFKIGLFNSLARYLNPLLGGLNNQGANLNQAIRRIDAKDVLSENEQLKKQVSDLQKNNADLLDSAQKLDLLSKQLGFYSKQKNSPILANIIGQDDENGINYYILDRGVDDGIAAGAAVVINDGFLVGKIIKVQKSHSYLLPLYDNHFLTSVDFLTTEKTGQLVSGLAQGKQGLGIEVKFVPLDISVKTGDYLITSGLEKNIPRGLIVGQVSNVEKKNDASFQNISIQSLISWSNTRIVMVLTSGAD
jgi:rod shape-determining protein MreC